MSKLSREYLDTHIIINKTVINLTDADAFSKILQFFVKEFKSSENRRWFYKHSKRPYVDINATPRRQFDQNRLRPGTKVTLNDLQRICNFYARLDLAVVYIPTVTSFSNLIRLVHENVKSEVKGDVPSYLLDVFKRFKEGVYYYEKSFTALDEHITSIFKELEDNRKELKLKKSEDNTKQNGQESSRSEKRGVWGELPDNEESTQRPSSTDEAFERMIERLNRLASQRFSQM